MTKIPPVSDLYAFQRTVAHFFNRTVPDGTYPSCLDRASPELRQALFAIRDTPGLWERRSLLFDALVAVARQFGFNSWSIRRADTLAARRARSVGLGDCT